MNCGVRRVIELAENTDVELVCEGNHQNGCHVVTTSRDGVTVMFVWPILEN